MWNLGTVGNDEASTIKCTCPVEFDGIEYDTPRSDWVLNFDQTSGVQLNQQVAINNCNPAMDTNCILIITKQITRIRISVYIHNTAYSQCTDTSESWTDSLTLSTQHSWGYVFKAGVTYTEGASVEVDGVGAQSSVSFSVEESWSTGGSTTKTQTVTSTELCTAKPMTRVDCQYMAYKGSIEMGYTIYWKNASPTRGVYRGTGWKSVLHATTTNL